MSSTSLVTDFYQISMAHALFRLGKHENRILIGFIERIHFVEDIVLLQD